MKIHHFLPVCALLIIGSLYIESPVERFGHSPYADPTAFFSWYPALFLFLMWIFYTVANRFLYSVKLSRVHVIATILALAFLYITPLLHYHDGLERVGAPRRYFDYGLMAITYLFKFFEKPVQAFIPILLASQLIFLLNLALGIKGPVNGAISRSGR